MTNPCNFSKLVRESAERIRESGSPALGELYDLTSLRLIRFAATITHNQHDAEDAVASVLLKMMADIDVLVAADAPWPYLLQMVRNEALQILRKKKRWSLAQGILGIVSTPTINHLEKQESDSAVWLALQRIPNQQSEVIVLKIWEGFTFQEIGKVLGLPTQTVASRYRYGLEKLSQLLGHSFAEELR